MDKWIKIPLVVSLIGIAFIVVTVCLLLVWGIATEFYTSCEPCQECENCTYNRTATYTVTPFEELEESSDMGVTSEQEVLEDAFCQGICKAYDSMLYGYHRGYCRCYGKNHDTIAAFFVEDYFFS